MKKAIVLILLVIGLSLIATSIYAEEDEPKKLPCQPFPYCMDDLTGPGEGDNMTNTEMLYLVLSHLYWTTALFKGAYARIYP